MINRWSIKALSAGGIAPGLFKRFLKKEHSMLAIPFTAFGMLAQEATATAPARVAETIQPLGWLFLIVSVGFVVLLTLWCYTRILTLPTDPAEVAEGD
jgi:preprotein translocase subunit SecY